MSSSVSAISGLSFAGSSSYAGDFQQVLTRAVQLASLPAQQLQNNVNDLTSQQQALASLESTFIALQGTIQSITASSQGISVATVSDPSVVKATTTAGALPGVYSIEVDDVGSSTTALSSGNLLAVTDPNSGSISFSHSYTLTINGVNKTITPAGTTLASLVSTINASQSGVHATIVNLGGSTLPDYRLSLVSDELGSDSIQLNDGTQNLLTTVATGSLAQYKPNGSATSVQSDSNQVTIAPGITVNLLEADSSNPTTITVTNDTSSLQNAFSSFAAAYNSAVDAVTQERGQNGGPLSGQSVLFSLSNVLSKISGYSNGSGTISSLSDLGFTLDQTGHLSFSASTFDSQDISAVQQFLGDATSGFVQTATSGLNSITDPTTGSLLTESIALQDTITSENAQIAEEQLRITALQNQLEQQLAAADAVIANLESQKSFYTNLFAAEFLQNGPGQG